MSGSFISENATFMNSEAWLQMHALQHGYGDLRKIRGPELVSLAYDIYGSRLSVLSSFGAESAVLLSWAADIDKNMRVLFIDTGKLFPETHAYKDRLVSHLGLTNIRILRPDPDEIRVEDPASTNNLWQRARRQCCDLRKVRPLERETTRILSLSQLTDRLAGPVRRETQDDGGIVAILNGVKGLHGGGRGNAPNFIQFERRVDFSPLFNFTREEVEAEFLHRNLPRHPLTAEGYTSIGCSPATCTSLPKNNDPRSGRFTAERPEGAVCHINLSDRRPLHEAPTADLQ